MRIILDYVFYMSIEPCAQTREIILADRIGDTGCYRSWRPLHSMIVQRCCNNDLQGILAKFSRILLL
jgi:hypothetical protein